MFEQCRMGKILVNTTIFQLDSAVAVLTGHVVFMISKIDFTLFDIT